MSTLTIAASIMFNIPIMILIPRDLSANDIDYIEEGSFSSNMMLESL